MTLEIIIVLCIIAITLFMFVTERFSVDLISMIAMTLLMVSGILTPSEGFAGFTNSATIIVACMYIISAAIYKCGVLDRVSHHLVAIGQKNYYLILLLLTTLSGLLSAFMNDTAVVALLLPVTLEVARKTRINASRLLMPISFGALLGGICTLIGTSTNILVSGIAEKNGLRPLGMFEMAPAGLCFLAVGILYMLFAGKYLLPDRRHKDNLAEEFDMEQYLTEIVLLPGSKSVGLSIVKSPLVRELEIKIIQISRRGVTIQPHPLLQLEENDVLKISCDIEKLKRLMEREGIRFKSRELSDQDLASSNILFVEAMVSVHSAMENQSLKEYGFRMRFNGATVLAVRHREEVLHEKLGRVRLRSGDVLLISANREQLEFLKGSDDVMIISETEHQPFKLGRMVSIVAVLGGVMLSAALGVAPIVLCATVGVGALVLLRLMRAEEAYRSVDWKVIFMLAGILSLGTALEKTGAAALLADGIIHTAGSLGPRAILSLFFGITFLAGNFMSHTATAALLTPIAILTASHMGVDSRPLIIAVAFAASFNFMTPIGHQTNIIVFAAGNYKFNDYLRTGTPLNLLFWILASFIIPYFYPF
jgi:di/tricarboxylate transporter